VGGKAGRKKKNLRCVGRRVFWTKEGERKEGTVNKKKEKGRNPSKRGKRIFNQSPVSGGGAGKRPCKEKWGTLRSQKKMRGEGQKKKKTIKRERFLQKKRDRGSNKRTCRPHRGIWPHSLWERRTGRVSKKNQRMGKTFSIKKKKKVKEKKREEVANKESSDVPQKGYQPPGKKEKEIPGCLLEEGRNEKGA